MGSQYGGLQTMQGLMNGAQTYVIFLIVGFFASLIGSFVIFRIYVSGPEGKSGSLRQVRNVGFLQRFVRFQKLIVADVMRWLYVFLALLVAVEGIIGFIYNLTLMSYSGFALWIALVNLVVTILLELLIRVVHEMQMLTVHLANDTSHIRAILADRYGESDSGLDLGLNPIANSPAYTPSYVATPAQPVQPTQPFQSTPSYQSAPSQPQNWYCPQCNTQNSGAFCRRCGHPRPQ